jgi:hypothetical protein
MIFPWNITERNVLLEWSKEMTMKPKLDVIHKIFDLRLAQRWWSVCDRSICSMLMKLKRWYA